MTRKILIVEDDFAMASFTRRVLEDHGFEAQHAEDAVSALEHLAHYTPSLIVTDVNMPGISGLKLVELLRADAKSAGIPILILSVLGCENDRIKGLHAGADDYLVKPFSPAELAARIEAILRRSVSRAGHFLQAGEIRVDLDRHEVSGPCAVSLAERRSRREAEFLARA